MNLNLFKYKSVTKKLFFLQVKTLYSKSNSKDNSIVPLIIYNNIESEKV